MLNIKQITNYDVASTCPLVTRDVEKAGQIVTWRYYDITPNILGTNKILKFGYCVEPKGIAYPIFLEIEGLQTTDPSNCKDFQIGKTGMFEFQEEEWRDVNGDDTERTATVYCSRIQVPVGIKFTINYCYEQV